MSDLTTFAGRLRDAMTEARVRNGEIADATGRNPVTVSQWRGGRQLPDDDAMDALARRLGVRKAWLRDGEEPRHPPALVSDFHLRDPSRTATNARVAAPTGPEEATQAAHRTRVLEQELRLLAVKAHLDDIELAAVSQMIRGALVLPAGGLPPLSPEQELQQVEAIAVGVREWIKLRAALRRRAQ